MGLLILHHLLYAKAWELYQNNQYEAAADALRVYERADRDWLLSNPTMKEQIDEAIRDCDRKKRAINDLNRNSKGNSKTGGNTTQEK